ncbi:hypothetical protein HELRODRAFT_194592 [Helobdella robusta]|uniref:Ras-GEF domain-containing protein n=1 Tax=Helobdella robusta TaxID=6412 RepID=T1FW83_HELRO|nr:hypothetical protein HELRODRAFT_194592 [Helobdella robusta]ESN91045.1 hypothetical protein HELRODRAFT_194592 [Helobdella robusta]
MEQMNLDKGKWTGSQPLLSVAIPSSTSKPRNSNIDRCPSMPHVSNKIIFSIKSFDTAAADGDDDDDNNTSANYSDSCNRVDYINKTNSTTNKSMLDSSFTALAKQSKIADINNNISGNNVTINDINNNNQNIRTIPSAAKPESYLNAQQSSPKSTNINHISPPSYKLSHSSSHESSSSLLPNSKKSSTSSSSSSAPPKPSRIATLKMQASSGTVRPVIKIRNTTLYEGIDDDIENTNSNAIGGNGKNRISSRDPTTICTGDIFSPLSSSYFKNIEEYKSDLITPCIKPLDQKATSKIRQLLLQNNPNLISKHITFVDIELTRLNQFVDTSLGSLSGLELTTLFQGQQLRQDIIERHYSMKLFVGATILFSPSLEERCDILAHWLNVAFELKVNAGNIFSFFSVMEAVCSFQVVRQKNVWKLLKMLHPSTFEIFEGKLLANYKSFLDGSAVILPYQRDTILPHLLPLVEILEKYAYEGDDVATCDAAHSSPTSAKLHSWEMNQPFYGLDIVLIHLDTTRLITQRVHLYLTASSNFQKSNPHRVTFLLDLLDPRTQARYLWGSKGVVVNRFDRVSKLDSLLTILSEKYEQ